MLSRRNTFRIVISSFSLAVYWLSHCLLVGFDTYFEEETKRSCEKSLKSNISFDLPKKRIIVDNRVVLYALQYVPASLALGKLTILDRFRDIDGTTIDITTQNNISRISIKTPQAYEVFRIEQLNDYKCLRVLRFYIDRVDVSRQSRQSGMGRQIGEGSEGEVLMSFTFPDELKPAKLLVTRIFNEQKLDQVGHRGAKEFLWSKKWRYEDANFSSSSRLLLTRDEDSLLTIVSWSK